MKTLINQYSQLVTSKTCYAVMASFLSLTLAGCGDAASDNGQVVNTVELPTDAFTSLYCPDEGVGEESCVLFNPVNPYARSAINGVTKWDLANEAPSSKSRFYLWATAHARDAQGENQFYAADSLHAIFRDEGSILARDQAKRAYRVVLDDFFGSVTFTGPVNAQTANLLRNWTADRFVSPGNAGLPQLYDSQSEALQALDEWGYLYDANTATISRKIN